MAPVAALPPLPLPVSVIKGPNYRRVMSMATLWGISFLLGLQTLLNLNLACQ